MIAYDKKLLGNTFFIDGAEALQDGGFITKEQFNEAQVKTPILKTQRNLLVRIGFFFLGTLLYSSIVGVISLLTFSIFELAHFEWAIYSYALVGLVGSELLTQNNYFGYGLDDAFVLGFLAMICIAIGVNTESFTAGFAAMAVFGVLCSLRYVNAISALIGLIGMTGFCCCLSFDLEIVPKFYLPFMGFFLAIVTYVFYHKMHDKREAYFYQYPMQIVQVFSLILGYASVNYFVVRELSVDLMNIVVTTDNDIPFAWIFYILTFAIPIVYLGYSLQVKSREMLLIGALALGCSIMTIRHYYSVMPPEIALILAGIILFVLAYFLIRKLRHKESGITFERDRHSDQNSLMYAQAIIVNSQISVNGVEDDSGEMPFGGGGFSGGGSSETF